MNRSIRGLTPDVPPHRGESTAKKGGARPSGASAAEFSPGQSAVRYAGFWLRFIAAIIDWMVLAVPFAVFVSLLSVAMKISNAFVDLRPGEPPGAILEAFGPAFLFWSLCFFMCSGWLYFALLESSPWQATVGKRVLGLHVVDVNGKRVTFGRASVRFAGGRLLMHVPVVGVYYFLIDCIAAGVTSRKRAIHDLVAGCQVLRKNDNGRLFPG